MNNTAQQKEGSLPVPEKCHECHLALFFRDFKAGEKQSLLVWWSLKISIIRNKSTKLHCPQPALVQMRYLNKRSPYSNRLMFLVLQLLGGRFGLFLSLQTKRDHRERKNRRGNKGREKLVCTNSIKKTPQSNVCNFTAKEEKN